MVSDEGELAPEMADYLEIVAKPYFNAVVNWLENLRIGMRGGDMYALIEQALPKAEYHWHLNPGHLVADEEWLCSPIGPPFNRLPAKRDDTANRHHSFPPGLRRGKH